MEIETVQRLSKNHKQQIFEIWNDVYPKQIVYQSVDGLEKYLSDCSDPTHLLAKIDGKLVGWLCAFDRDGGRWFVLIIDSRLQRQGIGLKLLSKMKALESFVYGWMVPHEHYVKSNGEPYRSPKVFYEKAGFSITNEEYVTEIMSTVKIVWKAQ